MEDITLLGSDTEGSITPLGRKDLTSVIINGQLMLHHNLCHQGGFGNNRYGLLIFSWARKVGNEKDDLSFVKPAFSPACPC